MITRALAELRWKRADYRPATVQRLDRNTSGAVIIALTGGAQRKLAELIRLHMIRKIYHAVVEGDAPESGRIDKPLLKDPQTNIVRADPAGQRAETLFKKICGAGGRSVVEAELITGRTHQIRAHLLSAGFPLIGDPKYGDPKINAEMKKRYGLSTQLLHAYKLDIQGITVTAKLPDMFEKMKKELIDVSGKI